MSTKPEPGESEAWKFADLEFALSEACMMANVSVGFINHSLGFEGAKPPIIDEEQCNQLSFVVTETCLKIEKAKEAFYARPK